MKKKLLIISLALCLGTIPNSMVFASSAQHVDSIQASSTDNVPFIANTVGKNSRLSLLNKFKANKDIEVVSDNGDGWFTIAPSSNVKTKDDMNRFLNSINQGATLGSGSLGNSTDTPNGAGGYYGVVTQSLSAQESDNDPKGKETATINNGLTATEWHPNGNNTSWYNWSRLTGMQDVITFQYDNVSTISSITFTGGQTPTTGSTTSWNKGTSSSSFVINWSDYNTPNTYYSKYFGGIGITTDNVTGAAISSTSMASFSFASQVSATSYKFIAVH